MAAAISVKNIVVHRGTFELRIDNLEIAAGEIFALLGRTGSGKTVLMESIAGAFPLDEGSILMNSHDLSDIPIQNRNLGVLYQDYALFPHMTVFDNIAYGLRRTKTSTEEVHHRVTEMLKLFQIEQLADKRPGIISGGEAQRTALARALVLRPEALILDEPFSALDPTTKLHMYDMLRSIHKRFGCTIIFVTHDFNEAQTLAERIGIILDGRLEAITSSAELFDVNHTPAVQNFLGMETSQAECNSTEKR